METLLLVCTLLLAVFFIIVSQHFKKKNKALEKKITELNKDTPKANIKPMDKDIIEEYNRILKAVYDDKLYADQHMDRDKFAARMAISRHSLNRIITGNTDGKSFPQWLNNIRIEVGSNILLKEPEKPVTVVAKEVGLTPNNFHRLFRLQYGMTPNEYRQNAKPQTNLKFS